MFISYKFPSLTEISPKADRGLNQTGKYFLIWMHYPGWVRYHFPAKHVQKKFWNHSIHRDNNSMIILFTKNLKRLFFCLDISIEGIIKALCCFWIYNRCKTPTKHKMRVSSPDVFKYNKTEPFFFKFVSTILNIGFLRNFFFEQTAKMNIVQVGKYFVYEREEITSFSRLSGKTTGELFSYEQRLTAKSISF